MTERSSFWRDLERFTLTILPIQESAEWRSMLVNLDRSRGLPWLTVQARIFAAAGLCGKGART